MTKDELIKYIREYDAFFSDAHFENYSYHELMLIKISIEVERDKKLIADYKPIEQIAKSSLK
jgi:hypothetical protein